MERDLPDVTIKDVCPDCGGPVELVPEWVEVYAVEAFLKVVCVCCTWENTPWVRVSSSARHK